MLTQPFVASTGLEPATPGLKGRCAHQLRHEANYRLYFILGHILHKLNDKF